INFSSYYTFISPSAMGPKAAYFSFKLNNDEVGVATDCRASTSMPLGQIYPHQRFDCSTEDVTTTFSYDTSTKVVGLNSTWSCGGDIVYSITLSGNVDFKCKTTTWANPDWEDGKLFSNTSTICQPSSLVIG
ncbi:hypothetical protein CC86DRAFT_258055, partial [Ophiobolus disseminans]